jgi:hypothetical protein
VTLGAGAGAFSMAVDHRGTAYVVYGDDSGDGQLFTASTATADCSATSAHVDVGAFTQTFGMGFASNPGGIGETLFLASNSQPGQVGELATLDTTSFMVSVVGTFSQDIGGVELTGTGDGRLFAFGVGAEADGADLAELQPTTAVVLSDTVVPTPVSLDDWAFAFWGGDFYFFTSTDNATSTVSRFHPADGSFDAAYASLPTGAISGAGVSTCAPR